VPTSFEGPFGKIVYRVRADIDTPRFSKDHKALRPFYLLNMLNLNEVPAIDVSVPPTFWADNLPSLLIFSPSKPKCCSSVLRRSLERNAGTGGEEEGYASLHLISACLGRGLFDFFKAEQDLIIFLLNPPPLLITHLSLTLFLKCVSRVSWSSKN